MKENQQILNGKNSQLDFMVKSPILGQIQVLRIILPFNEKNFPPQEI
jgi:hypothetical protein